MIPEGTYKAEFVSARYHKLGTKETPCIEVYLNINGEEKVWNGWINSGENLERTARTLTESLGFTGDDTIHEEDGPLKGYFKFDAFTKKECNAVVRQESFMNDRGEQKTVSKIAFLNPLGGGTKFQHLEVTVVKTDLKALGFKAAILAAKASQPKTFTGADGFAPTKNGGAEVPF
jgi:hypothetical protein